MLQTVFAGLYTESEDYQSNYELCSWIHHAMFSRLFSSMFYDPFSYKVFKAAPSPFCETAGGAGMLLLK